MACRDLAEKLAERGCVSEGCGEDWRGALLQKAFLAPWHMCSVGRGVVLPISTNPELGWGTDVRCKMLHASPAHIEIKVTRCTS